jgi:NTE family protein
MPVPVNRSCSTATAASTGCTPWPPLAWSTHLAAPVVELRAGGSAVETIFPDSDSEHVFGANAMDLEAPRRTASRMTGTGSGRSMST